MASFTIPCVMNPNKINSYGPNPSTSRGNGIHIHFHPKEPRIAYASGKFIIVRNLENPTDTFIYRGHSHTTACVKFSPNGYWVASGDISGKVRVWSWDHPEHILKVETTICAGTIYDLDWDFESKKIVAAGEGSGIMVKCFIWDTGNSAGEMVGHNKKILSVAYKPTRPFRIMTGGEDFKTCFYQGPPFQFNHSNTTHTNFVSCVRYSKDGNQCVSVGSDKKIQFYDGATGMPTTEITEAHAGSIYSAAFSPDGTKLITAGGDKLVKQWDIASLSCEKTFTLSADPQVGDMQAAVLWTDNYMISVSINGDINILDPDNVSTPKKTLQNHQVAITSLYLEKGTNNLYTGSFDGVVIVRDLETKNSKKVISSDKKSVCGAAHSNKIVGLTVQSGSIISAGWDDRIRFASPETNQYHSEVALNGQPVALASNEVSDFIVVITNKEIALFKGQDKIAFLANLSYTPTCVALYMAEEIAVGGDDNKTHIYKFNGSTLEVVSHIETRSAVSALDYSCDNKLAIGDAGRQIEIYERGTWEAIIKGKWVFHTSRITSLAWSPTGAQLASGSLDESIIIWSLAKPSNKTQYSFAHVGGISGLAWYKDVIVSSGGDHTVLSWKAPVADA